MAQINTRNPEPFEIIGSKDLRESFKDQDRIRGSWFINDIEMHQFDANSPASVVAQINAKTGAHFVTAEIDDGGHLVLIDKSGAKIRIGQGAAYVETAPIVTGNVGADVAAHLDHRDRHRDDRGNHVLELLGLDETANKTKDTGYVRPGFETGRSAEERRKARESATGVIPAAQPQNPTNPTPGGSDGSQGRLQDGRGRTGTGGGNQESSSRAVENREVRSQ